MNEEGADSGIELVVLSGRQAGAKIAIEFGAVLLGKGPHCDIVLRDDGVEAEHLLLIVGEDRITIRTLTPPPNGSVVAEQPLVQYSPGLTITVGVARIGLAPPGFDWEEASRERKSSVEQLSEPIDELPPPSVRHGRIVGAAVAVAVAFALIGGAIKASWRTNAPTEGEREQVVRTRVDALGFHEVYVQALPDGRLALRGYVPDLTAMHKLRQLAVDQGLSMKVHPASELTRFAAEWLASHDLKAQVLYLGDGALEIIGQETSDGRLGMALDRLAKEVPGVVSVSRSLAAADPEHRMEVIGKSPESRALAGVNGVNTGATVPYISSGDSYIFTGGTLKNGMTVTAIEPDRVLFDDRGRQLVSEIQIR